MTKIANHTVSSIARYNWHLMYWSGVLKGVNAMNHYCMYLLLDVFFSVPMFASFYSIIHVELISWDKHIEVLASTPHLKQEADKMLMDYIKDIFIT